MLIAMKNATAALQGMVSWLAITVPVIVIYMLGIAYDAGYLRGWGVPMGLVPLGYQAILERGSFALMGFASALPWWLAFAGAFAVLFSGLVAAERLAVRALVRPLRAEAAGVGPEETSDAAVNATSRASLFRKLLGCRPTCSPAR